MKVKLLQNCVGHCLGEIVDLSDLQAERLLDKNRATRDLKYEIPQKVDEPKAEAEVEVVKEKHKSKKTLVIVGWSETTRKLAPCGPDYERWACNGGDMGRQFLDELDIDVWFELHRWKTRTLRAREWMQSLDKPVYLIEIHDEVPTGRQFPFREIWDYMDGEKYVTNTIVYMLIFAAVKGFKEIHLYGADMVLDEEYFYQRVNTEYVIGNLRGKGIKIVIPVESPLCKSDILYAFEVGESETSKQIKELAVKRKKRIEDEDFKVIVKPDSKK